MDRRCRPDTTTEACERPLIDLLRYGRVNTASGDAGWHDVTPPCKAVWTTPIAGEEEAPARRIIHCRTLRLHAPARLERIGVRSALGYHKCGSHAEFDWVKAFRLLIWTDHRWEMVRHETNLPCPPADEVLWFDLGGITTSSAIIETRECGIDPWWPSWNLATGAYILEGDPPLSDFRAKENRLTLEVNDLRNLPCGIQAQLDNGEVRFRSRFLEVGFSLGRAGFSYLSLDDEGTSRTNRNLLRSNPGVFLQGVRLHTLDAIPTVAPLLRNDVTGTVHLRGNTVTYNIQMQEQGQQFALSWEVLEDRILFRAEKTADRELRAWESSIWTIACHSEVTPTSTLGRITRTGEAGNMHLPVYFHAPGFGSLMIEGAKGEAVCRSDSIRPLQMTTMELKLGEVPQPEGDYLLLAGRHTLEAEMCVRQPAISTGEVPPPAVARAFRRCVLTSMSYRADTATLTNNGNSMHCPLCMDNWSALAIRVGRILPGLSTVDLLRDSLERWLTGGPGYASGRMRRNDDIHLAEDEYIMTGTAGLLGLGEFLDHAGSVEWLEAFAPQISRELLLMRERDLDGDGLVESPYRLGVSGDSHWGTCWYDVISFGWKDAFSNALLYRALLILSDVLPRLGRPDLAGELAPWAEKLRSYYLPTFFNPATGWLGGWRCKAGKLHDHGFLAVNGAAVCSGIIPEDIAKEIIRRLWDEAQRIGLPDARLGLPGNLWRIPDEDLVEIMHGQPMGYYQNGGVTHSQSRHFVSALYQVGMSLEADSLLVPLCESLGDGTAFGGCNTGVDWRFWDGWPCGYEGLLTDQFGILAVAMDRFGRRWRGTTTRVGDSTLQPTLEERRCL